MRIADHLAQVRQRLAQIMPRDWVGLIGPEQPGQRITLVRPIGLDNQVGQQRPDFIRLESS